MPPNIDTAVAAYTAHTVPDDSLGRINKSVDGNDTANAAFAVAVFVEIVTVADMEDKGIADGGPVVCAAVVPVTKAVAAGMAYYDYDRAHFAIAVVEGFSENVDHTAVMPQTDLDLFGVWFDCFD